MHVFIASSYKIHAFNSQLHKEQFTLWIFTCFTKHFATIRNYNVKLWLVFFSACYISVFLSSSDLSQHVVTDCKQAIDLLEEGIANRITAATHNHDASSRSHAIFSIQYTQVISHWPLTSHQYDTVNPLSRFGRFWLPLSFFPPQAILENNLPSEIVSKINLVDLAGR